MLLPGASGRVSYKVRAYGSISAPQISIPLFDVGVMTADHQKSTHHQRGNSPLTTLLLLALLFLCVGVVVFYVVWRKPGVAPQQQSQPISQSATETLDVLVPLQKIDTGMQLDPSMFRKETRAIVGGSANLVTSFDQLRSAYAASFIAAGEPVMLDYITANPPLNQIQAKIPDGFRAVTMSVDSTTSVEGWARAGAKVDVMLTPSRVQKPTLTVIVQNAKVLSASRSTSGDPGASPSDPKAQTTVTLMVTGDDAAKIQLAAKSGSLSLALRGDEDTVESPQNTTIGIETILGSGPKQPSQQVKTEGMVTVGGKNYFIVAGKLLSPEEVSALSSNQR